MHFIDRIIQWNANRYPQEYDHRLTCELITEEALELTEAHSEVDQLDALVDGIYISIGAMWKMGLSAEQIIIDGKMLNKIKALFLLISLL